MLLHVTLGRCFQQTPETEGKCGGTWELAGLLLQNAQMGYWLVNRMPALNFNKSLLWKQITLSQQACTLKISLYFYLFKNFSSLVFCTGFIPPTSVALFFVPKICPTNCCLGTTGHPVPSALNTLLQIFPWWLAFWVSASLLPPQWDSQKHLH